MFILVSQCRRLYVVASEFLENLEEIFPRYSQQLPDNKQNSYIYITITITLILTSTCEIVLYVSLWSRATQDDIIIFQNINMYIVAKKNLEVNISGFFVIILKMNVLTVYSEHMSVWTYRRVQMVDFVWSLSAMIAIQHSYYRSWFSFNLHMTFYCLNVLYYSISSKINLIVFYWNLCSRILHIDIFLKKDT